MSNIIEKYYEIKGEIWKDIKGWRKHQVSNRGRVRVLPGGRVLARTVVEIELRVITPNSSNHVIVTQGEKHHVVHRLMLIAFAGEPPPGCEARHINGNTLDNRYPENVKWATTSDIRQDQFARRRRRRNLEMIKKVHQKLKSGGSTL
jgi:NUMOD4 motif/HNH endonuclease